MAKVTFGAGTKVSVAPVKKEILAERHPVIDVQAIVEKAISELPIPKYDETFGSALGQLRDEMKHEVNAVRQMHEALKSNVESLGADMEVEMMTLASHMEHMSETKAPSPIVHPEIKSITHVKDVSSEVMEHVNANKQELKGDLMCHANHLVAIETRLKLQMVLNIVMASALVLTILSRFI